MIDLHTHVLPGFDDGVRSLEQALELVREAQGDGVTAIAATPHVRNDYPTSADKMERGVAALRSSVQEAGIQVEIVTGGEVAFERLWQLPDEEVRRFTYGGTGRYLLVEFPYGGWPQLAEQTVRALGDHGIRAVLAHPERNDVVGADPARLERLVVAGALVQVTAGSLAGRFGAGPRVAARALVARGLVHVLASDAHGPHIPRGRLADGPAALGDEALARRLTVEIPGAILAGVDV